LRERERAGALIIFIIAVHKVLVEISGLNWRLADILTATPTIKGTLLLLLLLSIASPVFAQNRQLNTI
jgi:hypothetical protein